MAPPRTRPIKKCKRKGCKRIAVPGGLFCCVQCCWKWRKGRMPPGGFPVKHKPWNRDKKGIHLSPYSQFKKGSVPVNKAAIGTVKIRRRKNDHFRPRAWIKVAEPNKWELRAVVNWKKKNGPIPKGFVVHHKNRNTLSDGVRNLELQTRAEHILEHHAELLLAKRRSAYGNETKES